MEGEYREEEWLQLSGIQHFVFCRRQWALIHIEQQWDENTRTVEGELLHENVHDPYYKTKRVDVLTVRAMRIHSARLGIAGECDAVEFHECPDGITLVGREGRWRPYPVEYKRGSPKQINCDKAQLCAQVMCLEEMLCCDIPEAAIYYGEIRHREIVQCTQELRRQVSEAAAEMHNLYRKGQTPRVKRSKGCNACSLKDVCLPGIMRKNDVKEYMRREGGIDS